MQPQLNGPNITAMCPDCGFPSTFERFHEGRELGHHTIMQAHAYNLHNCDRIVYRLYRCASCSRGGMAKLHPETGRGTDIPPDVFLEWFYPAATRPASLPEKTPEDLIKELREAELCASVGAWRAASAMIRSTLEKALKANGYTKENDKTLKDLQKRIDAAAADGIITTVRQKKAHDDIRALGNDVLHDDWREVEQDEFETAHHYIQRILEDFYDDRPSVEKILTAKKRLPAPPGPQNTL